MLYEYLTRYLNGPVQIYSAIIQHRQTYASHVDLLNATNDA